MKKKWAFYVCVFSITVLLGIVNDIVADTNVSGYISSDTTWTQANSPYVATGNVIVRSGITLTIEPGVTVKFDGDKSLQIYGTLIAKGTSAEKITFTRNSSNNWGYILCSSTPTSYDSSGNYTSGSIMEYCIVEYAGRLQNGAVVMGASPFINHCTIRNNATSGIYATHTNGLLKIINSIITNNTGYGIFCYGGTNVISDNSITENTSNGIYCYDESINTISNNTIINNARYGIICYSDSNITRGTTTITSNIINNNTDSGIYSYHNTTTITGNVIINNKTESDSSKSYSGCGIYSEASTITISNNILSANDNKGIYSDSSTITIISNCITRNFDSNTLGIVTVNTGGDLKYNTITENKAMGTIGTYTVYLVSSSKFNYNNIFNNTATYELWHGKSQSMSNLDAKNNWWGTADDSAVQGKIYDWIDDNTMGLVDYYPYETVIRTDCPISPPTGMTATAGSGQIALSWSANSESDTEGYKVYWDTDSGYSYANSVDVGSATSYTITGLANGKYYVTVTAYDTDYNSSSDSSDTIINENQTNGNESWYAEENTVTLGSVTTTPTPSPRASPTPQPLPSGFPTISPFPTTTPSQTPAPGGSGVIYGFVYNADEESLKNVTVNITGNNFSDSTTTDEDGYYEFSGIKEGDYTLSYEKEGYQTYTEDISLGEGEEMDMGTIIMETVENGMIYGYVVNIKGNPVEYVRLKLKGIKTKTTKQASSDADGFFEFSDLEADTYIITAKKKGFKPVNQRIKLGDEEVTDIEIVLKKSSRRIAFVEH